MWDVGQLMSKNCHVIYMETTKGSYAHHTHIIRTSYAQSFQQFCFYFAALKSKVYDLLIYYIQTLKSAASFHGKHRINENMI